MGALLSLDWEIYLVSVWQPALLSKFPMNKSSQPFEQKPACDTNEATWGS